MIALARFIVALILIWVWIMVLTHFIAKALRWFIYRAATVQQMQAEFQEEERRRMNQIEDLQVEHERLAEEARFWRVIDAGYKDD